MTPLTDSGIKQMNRNETRLEDIWHRISLINMCLILCIIIFLVVHLILANQVEVDYISAKEIQSYDHSQLSITDGTGYYSWYDWDRRSGKVYLITEVNGEVTSVESAYGENGALLYIDPAEL